MFVRIMRKDEKGKVETSIFEGNACHTACWKGSRKLREFCKAPEKFAPLDDYRVFIIERDGLDALRLLVRLDDIQSDELHLFLMNDRGETIERIYG